MSEPVRLLLRILSGIHAGAQMPLTDGGWVIGRDDSCDIILQDDTLAARHANLAVKEGSVKAQAMDGRVTDDTGAELTDQDLLPGTAYRLGAVRFAWGPEDADAAFWEAASRVQSTEAAAETTPEEAAPAEDSKEETAQENAGEGTPDAQPEPTAAPDAPEGTADKPPVSRRPLYWGLGTVGVLVLLAAGLALAVARMNPDGETARKIAAFCEQKHIPFNLTVWQEKLAFLKKAPKVADDVLANDMLAKAGLTRVQATVGEDGFLVLAGVVADDAERGKLVQIARALPRSAQLDITVETDVTEPLAAAFNAKDFWPRVVLKDRTKDRVTLAVTGYIQDGATEENAFADAMKSAFPNGAKIDVERHILHRDALSTIVARALRESGADGVSAEWLPGRIRFLTTMTPERKKKLDAALASIRKKADPVRIDVVNQFVTQNSANSKKPVAINTAPTKISDPSRPSFRVSGVSGGAIKFVTLSTGNKYFVGGVLPGGFTLQSISYDKLVLTKNGKRIVYPLKVSR